MAKSRKTWSFAKTWKKFRPPTRPSEGTIKILEKYLDKEIKEKGLSTKVLILGSTPEFRSLVISKGLVPTVVDYSKDTFEALGALRAKRGKEVFVKQDWRKLNIKDKFDVILAEASINILPKKDVLGVLRKVSGLLKPSGYFLSKTWIRFPGKYKNMEEIVKHYRRYYKNKGFYPIYSPLFYSWLCGEKKSDSITHREIFFTYKRLYNLGVLTKKEFQIVQDLGYDKSPLELYIPLKGGIEKLFKKYFKIEKFEMGEYPFGKYTPTFVLTKK